MSGSRIRALLRAYARRLLRCRLHCVISDDSHFHTRRGSHQASASQRFIAPPRGSKVENEITPRLSFLRTHTLEIIFIGSHVEARDPATTTRIDEHLHTTREMEVHGRYGERKETFELTFFFARSDVRRSISAVGCERGSPGIASAIFPGQFKRSRSTAAFLNLETKAGPPARPRSKCAFHRTQCT